jgi:hypothetical protein
MLFNERCVLEARLDRDRRGQFRILDSQVIDAAKSSSLYINSGEENSIRGLECEVSLCVLSAIDQFEVAFKSRILAQDI